MSSAKPGARARSTRKRSAGQVERTGWRDEGNRANMARAPACIVGVERCDPEGDVGGERENLQSWWVLHSDINEGARKGVSDDDVRAGYVENAEIDPCVERNARGEEED
jgi:hypothetical protein